MQIDKDRVKTQDELGESAPMDQIEPRVEAKMKKLKGSAKKRVGQGLQNKKVERDGRQLEEEGERNLRDAE